MALRWRETSTFYAFIYIFLYGKYIKYCYWLMYNRTSMCDPLRSVNAKQSRVKRENHGRGRKENRAEIILPAFFSSPSPPSFSPLTSYLTKKRTKKNTACCLGYISPGRIQHPVYETYENPILISRASPYMYVYFNFLKGVNWKRRNFI